MMQWGILASVCLVYYFSQGKSVDVSTSYVSADDQRAYPFVFSKVKESIKEYEESKEATLSYDQDKLQSANASLTTVPEELIVNSTIMRNEQAIIPLNTPKFIILKFGFVCIAMSFLIYAGRRAYVIISGPRDYKTAWRSAFNEPSGSVKPTIMGRATRDVSYQQI